MTRDFVSAGAVDGTLLHEELFQRISVLKKEMNALILAHYYTVPEVQQVADIVGDSLALARAAEKNSADVIVFAGVYFMAETAKLLNPGKLVLMPDSHAGCPLADSCPPVEFRKFKESHPEALVITYINSTAEIKALSDITCTSSNAEQIIRQIPEEQSIIFAPDKNLGGYLARKLHREMFLWQGCCYVHDAFTEPYILQACREHPDAELIAHPECREEVLSHASFIGSTQALLQYTESSSAQSFIVATEPGILYEMHERSPGKVFIPAPKDSNNPHSLCTQMKQNTLQKLYHCMLNRSPEITVPEGLQRAALKPIRRMLDMSA
ncbi:quinolinate synthase NadA [Chlorobium sp. BLA1]|uniref:quinolinate synthase NadA n=1 Tax=Candidatus Chlorobium masyuteum TaxID=2716876 RepID=UPI00142335C7|nr:quinolinate synthase NadA [Candidatus Chlorobium masyuteum]NHQ60673.1 quinolinate synthase NadA [Candidatus Chlorobium masyuteum]